MRTPETPLLSRDLTNDRISMPYPHVKALELSEALALVVQTLPTGDLPVLCEYKGTTRQVASIRRSAITLSILAKVTDLVYYLDDNSSRELKDVTDIMEVL